MADDPSGNDTTDRWGEPSATDPDAEPTTEASETNEGDSSDGDWDRIPLDLSDSSDESDDEAATDDDEYAPEASSTPIESGDPDLENALFVVLGAIAMVLVLVRLLSVPL
ncbi:DUF7312 domain-containing protein [Natrinema versiforme]|uniref:DUF7312 domain-containing protein n=1 Tax=Natrinema versiforme JCM 10478 TaxID=1227496 RepID=L9YEJ5_9EURY|nr:hypothetical protein [Natrinema versiforme]ELY71373.1 hypothetical protein C489_00356 [Natrinema versiforme JCM 10478]